jgi:hypothetical protein
MNTLCSFIFEHEKDVVEWDDLLRDGGDALDLDEDIFGETSNLDTGAGREGTTQALFFFFFVDDVVRLKEGWLGN